MKSALLATRGKVRGSRGVALVITLILLAVITFMAITFLVVSQSERGAVSTTTDQTTARIAADNALERAKSELIMPIMAFSNAYAFDMLVSTNYFNRIGFVSNLESPTNVNFDYQRDAALSPLSPSDYLLNLHNLLYSPRVPVFMRDASGQLKSVHYLDINRNGLEERTGMLVVTNSRGEAVVDTNGRFVTNYFYGDPEWIGGLEFPERPHSATNRFTFRYAYVVAPVGKTLDINYMHNAGRFLPLMNGDGFVRNQGVGTWELNLGAFLTDLNTNMWYSVNPDYAGRPGWGSGYVYHTDDLGLFNQGAGFDDATALLRYRYARDWRTLWRPRETFGSPFANTIFANDTFDTYGSGPLWLTATNNPIDPDPVRLDRGWPGSFSTNLFASPSDFFDRNKTGIGKSAGDKTFTDRLEEAAKRPSSYDRYTFQRLLSQLGTESAPETPRINVNYKNVVAERVVSNLETNFIPWTPLEFFTNAANRLLNNAGFTFGITNIEVYPTNNYTPAVHRALQLAANIFEATTNKFENRPTIYRPRFANRTVGGMNRVFIVGYSQLETAGEVLPSVATYRDFANTNDTRSVGVDDMFYGIPVVVGARKGFPNFNEFSLDTKLTMSRKLEFRRQNLSSPVIETNVMYTVGLNNDFGVEFWNSYSNRLDGRYDVQVWLDTSTTITNQNGEIVYPNTFYPRPLPKYVQRTINDWAGFQNINMAFSGGSLVVPLETNNQICLPHSTYSDTARGVVRLTDQFERLGRFPVPEWKLLTRTRLRASIQRNGVLIDFVNLDRLEGPLNVPEVLQRNDVGNYVPVRTYNVSGDNGALWYTNRLIYGDLGSPTFGIQNQIAVSLGLVPAPTWGTNHPAGVDSFRAQFGLSPQRFPGPYSKSNIFYAPFVPTRDIHVYTQWEVNDPLVHYTPGDLTEMGRSNSWGFQMVTNTLRGINRRYEPWSNESKSGSENNTRFELAVKDPGVTRSDDWDFPTNKLANVGWLGRVHRGTPWQTVYLKSKVANHDQWLKWAGSGIITTNVGQIRSNMTVLNAANYPVIDDTVMSHPTNDWAILDVFTAALYDNATRGQLSINQTNLAAWSAVLSGVPVLTNASPDTWRIIQPAAVEPALDTIVGGIARMRASKPGGNFRRLAEICSVPELTEMSPFIDRNGDNLRFNVSEALYERIPQQILGLLRCEEAPRFVVYAYGQALKPANGSIEPSTGMVTNYQVTAEVATRAVVRVEGAPNKPRVVIENFNVLPPD